MMQMQEMVKDTKAASPRDENEAILPKSSFSLTRSAPCRDKAGKLQCGKPRSVDC